MVTAGWFRELGFRGLCRGASRDPVFTLIHPKSLFGKETKSVAVGFTPRAAVFMGVK